jgi:hypothetical protein
MCFEMRSSLGPADDRNAVESHSDRGMRTYVTSGDPSVGSELPVKRQSEFEIDRGNAVAMRDDQAKQEQVRIAIHQSLVEFEQCRRLDERQASQSGAGSRTCRRRQVDFTSRTFRGRCEILTFASASLRYSPFIDCRTTYLLVSFRPWSAF